ncbi:hypothetical protein MHY85_05310 [Cellulomonas sp. ACRRI]|uniref:hypothetical protein n=1 Tax=Cellulomonas sp. ACRRI TaxID=2918188 RepID=UPI001EF2B89F|nr:hypothetical protein [Cellulomonas sp. ACRRI]MCG7285394.1 hypothetical protein [Cellulomonas sp. ACRRI]
MKRLGLLWLASVYVAALVWGVPGVAWSLIAGLVVSFLVFPGYFATTDPYDSTSELDRRDGIGAR